MKHFALPKDGGLITEGLPDEIIHSHEEIRTEIFDEPSAASEEVSEIVIKAIKDFEAANPGKLFRLGLTSGATPVSLYNKLSRKYNEGRISFKNVEICSIDEYYPMHSDAMQSRNHILHTLLLDKIDILPENVHIPDATVPEDKISEYCAEFDKFASNIDLLVIGMGEDGQVGFNEPGASSRSRTRVILLPYKSRKRQAHNFNGSIADTPKKAITIGMGTMRDAKKVILMAWGEKKARAVKAIVEEKPTYEYPASFFQKHPDVTLFVDETAGSALIREVSPWMIGDCEWTPKFIRKAVVWLCQKVDKPILKLTLNDYLENSLDSLVDLHGPYDQINIKVFNDLQHTITGWPGGKPGCTDPTRPVASEPFPKRVIVFSPHPDDDVISMGGTLVRLTHQGHDVHVAYETSGNVAVHDDVVVQLFDAASQLGFGDRTDQVKALVASKIPGAPEPRELLNIKAAIRRSEARGACRSFGLEMSHVHFLNLPFYETGAVSKSPRTQADVDIVKNLLNEIKPHQVYMAGDLADPHGTHRVCTETALEAFEQLEAEQVDWIKDCHIWLYRGAWMEWEIGRVDMAVPLSPDEVIEKRHAIYRHLSQKDIVPFPGEDTREFWQRAEDRTQNTARIYDELGMAEYQAIEVFLKLK